MIPDALFHLGIWPVSAYQLCHAFAALLFVAMVLGGRKRGRAGAETWSAGDAGDPGSVRGAGLAALIAGAWLGSWVFGALVRQSVTHAGHSSFGALLGVLIAAGVDARAGRRPVLGAFDSVVPALAVADATARLGCHFAGCCHGRPAWGLPWALVFPADSACVFPGLPVHPVQLYLSFAGFALAGCLACLAGRDPRPGVILGVFLAGTGASRLLVEPFRSPAFESAWTIAGWVALLAVGAATLAWARARGTSAAGRGRFRFPLGAPEPLGHERAADLRPEPRGQPPLPCA